MQTLNRDASADGERYLPAAADVAREEDVAKRVRSSSNSKWAGSMCW